MSYAGNSSLSRDVQQRVLDTFEQTLDLAAEGSRQEALLGCDFVLRMDPQFEPARRLQDRLRASAGAIVDLDDLRPSAPSIPAPPDLFASLDGLGLELPDLPPESFAPDLHAEIRGLLEQRRFQELMAVAQQHGAAIATDPELQGLLGEAQERMEAEPYVQKFVSQARAALQAGQTGEVARLLEKARALDPTYPALEGLAAALRSQGAGAPQAPQPQMDLGAIPAETAGFDLSFDAPSLEGPAVDLFGSPGGATGDSDPRIQQLLDEGQRAFDQGDPQGAIDAWSRIFLIDIDHPEAGRRIDQARRLKAESERQVEEIFHDGVARAEAGDADGAKQIFQQVLEIQPGYTAAREYLQQIEAGNLPVSPRAAGPAAAPSVAASAASAADTLLPMEALGPLDDLKEEILVPPDPSEFAAAERKGAPKGKARGGRASQKFLLVGSLVLVLVAAGGWYVFQNRDQFFPNSKTEEGAGAPAADPIARAQALHDAGKTANAISQLRRLPPSDSQYQQAQALIAQWEATLEPEAAAPAPPGPAVPPPAPAIPAPQAALLTAAHQALAEGSRLRAVEYFEQAGQIGKLPPEETALLADARQQLEPLSRQIDLFRQHEWDFILNDLWKLHEENPRDRDVQRLIVDSYYNLGIRDLQRSDPAKAADKFKEAMRLAPDDELLRRHYLFAQTYQERDKDLLYRIYVKYLALR
jgi:tetratricopeptide (TPR) repeat protein